MIQKSTAADLIQIWNDGKNSMLNFSSYSLAAKAFMTSQQGNWTLKLPLFSDLEFANPDVNLSYTEFVIAPMSAIIDTLLKKHDLAMFQCQ